ncbi:hypothetical protein I316_01686 [Kwoniella heveanensis BCC8398]|uniref:Plasma membrane proteolipid 3 n=1 Tax=Kwoniella heveanensis BCC8398 TaxID=1296120 RepID=A0A1B9GZJ7_9TREE|nr:hypothetical protein I316_01686 [Kwoniella heveanensis BCC8398]
MSPSQRVRMSGEETAICVFLAFFLPPAAVGLADRAFTGAVCLNILLCILGWIPGIIHALFWVFFRSRRGAKSRTGIPFADHDQQGQQYAPPPNAYQPHPAPAPAYGVNGGHAAHPGQKPGY